MSIALQQATVAASIASPARQKSVQILYCIFPNKLNQNLEDLLDVLVHFIVWIVGYRM